MRIISAVNEVSSERPVAAAMAQVALAWLRINGALPVPSNPSYGARKGRIVKSGPISPVLDLVLSAEHENLEESSNRPRFPQSIYAERNGSCN